MLLYQLFEFSDRLLAGDIITFRDYTPLDRFLSGWKKPALFVAGNHEYYTKVTSKKYNTRFGMKTM